MEAKLEAFKKMDLPMQLIHGGGRHLHCTARPFSPLGRALCAIFYLVLRAAPSTCLLGRIADAASHSGCP
jgi:hypothetical protein